MPAGHSHPRPCSHHIQFYHHEPSLFSAISSFILPSFFSTTHAAVIVATTPHLESLDHYLRSQNLLPDLLRKRDQLFLAPADPILAKITPGNKLSRDEFYGFFEPLFARLQKRYPKLLVYGELVNILCERKDHELAHQLELTWEDFLEGKDASLLCGYNMAAFADAGLEDVFQRLCRAHSVVVPAEEDGGGGGGGVTGVNGRAGYEQMMLLAMLQQRSLRLAAEMGRRVGVEKVLRETMEHVGTRGKGGMGMVVARTGVEGVEWWFNGRFLELLRRSDQELRGSAGWLEHIDYRDREKLSHQLKIADGKARRCEYRVVDPTGTVRWLSGETVCRPEGYIHSCIALPDAPHLLTAAEEPHGQKHRRSATPPTPPVAEPTPSQLITQLTYLLHILHTPPPHTPSIALPSLPISSSHPPSQLRTHLANSLALLLCNAPAPHVPPSVHADLSLLHSILINPAEPVTKLDLLGVEVFGLVCATDLYPAQRAAAWMPTAKEIASQLRSRSVVGGEVDGMLSWIARTEMGEYPEGMTELERGLTDIRKKWGPKVKTVEDLLSPVVGAEGRGEKRLRIEEAVNR